MQATVPNSGAPQLVGSNAPTAEHYPNVINSLKYRFGLKDL